MSISREQGRSGRLLTKIVLISAERACVEK